MDSWLAALVIGALVLSGCAGGPSAQQDTPAVTASYALEDVATGLQAPVYATSGPDGRLYVAEQGGRILAVGADGATSTFLDLGGEVQSGGEQGLLGFAFDPHATGRLVVHYTGNDEDTHLADATFQPESGGAIASQAQLGRTLLTVADPYPNHNGGMVAFGPDGKLYLGLGDGGSGGDPQRHAQDTSSLLGKVLRLEPDGSPAPGNPFGPDAPDNGGGAPEVWAYGLRNPWRFSFDRETGDLWIGDVGQNAWEEVDHVAFHDAAGADFGWSAYEGRHPYNKDQSAPRHVEPVWEYENGDDGRCAVTGGYAYRGKAMPELVGAYVYGDYCNGKVWALRTQGGAWRNELLLASASRISSFGETAAGELLVVDHGGAVRQLVHDARA